MITQRGVTVVVDPAAVMFLIGTELDFSEDKLSATFVFNNPQRHQHVRLRRELCRQLRARACADARNYKTNPISRNLLSYNRIFGVSCITRRASGAGRGGRI